MGDYAASGGYYISCAANRIFADPTTLTGSIGIFGMMYSGEKLFTETLGLNFDVVKTNKMADLGASLGSGSHPPAKCIRTRINAELCQPRIQVVRKPLR